MNLEKGQRWRIKRTSAIIEVMDPDRGQCILKNTGVGSDAMGYIGYYSIALNEAIKHVNSKLEDTYLEYLEGQDAPK